MNIDSARSLLAGGLYDSAECMLSLAITQIPEESSEFVVYLEILGDVCFAKKQHMRALQYYQRALGRRSNATSIRPAEIENLAAAGVALKSSKAHLELKDSAAALRELNVIPQRFRSVEINMLLGKLYKQANSRKLAIVAYKSVLDIEPCAMEAIQHLLALGIDVHEITASFKGVDSNLSHILKQISFVVSALRSCDHAAFMVHYQQLDQYFPSSAWLLQCKARSLAYSDHIEEAIQAYRQLRRVDSTLIDGLEVFGLLLFEKNLVSELSTLANDVLVADNERPTGWLLGALYCQLRGEHDKAKRLCEKAVDIVPDAGCFNVKGTLLMAQGNCIDQALIAFFQANSLDKDPYSFAGLVNAHLSLGKIKDATSTAKDALALMPRCPVPYLLVGQCLSKTANGGLSESLKAYQKVLKFNSNHTKALSYMAESLISQDKLQEASICLRSALDRRNKADPTLRTQFAKVLASTGNYSEAIEQLHISIAHTLPGADNTEAVQELERVENVLHVTGDGTQGETEYEQNGDV
jgi:anaphase-promoting complex subunit 7